MGVELHVSGMTVGGNQKYVGEKLEPGRTQTLETAVYREKAKYSVTQLHRQKKWFLPLCRGKS